MQEELNRIEALERKVQQQLEERPAKRAASGSLSGPKTKIAIIAKQSSSVIPTSSMVG
jgi:lipid II:glycine glycyltransferase (peptidoglycan interpeptide bridge formation enzyme)